MNVLKAARQSPAMVLAALALVFAMVGTAVAGPDAVSRAITKSKVKTIAKKQAQKYFDANIAGASVANAANAATATNAQSLGGSAAANYAKRSFANVEYTGGVPAIVAQSGGISIVEEPFAGAVRINFPQDMTACAVTATSFTGGATTSLRRSSIGAGTNIVVIGFDDAGTTVETDFNVITQC